MKFSGVIAIDGPAGAGKSTIARQVAEKLGINYLDTGMLYRALAFYLDKHAVPPQDNQVLNHTLQCLSVKLLSNRIFVNGEDVTDQLRTPHIDKIASVYSALPSVRERLLDIQREQALSGSLVADGRDMGTVVFPLAPVKIFLTASAEVRADRRWRQLQSIGSSVSLESILVEIKQRDKADSERAIAPLRRHPMQLWWTVLD